MERNRQRDCYGIKGAQASLPAWFIYFLGLIFFCTRGQGCPRSGGAGCPRSDGGIKGWYSRGYLPHFDGGEILQFITLHLKDALPVRVINIWKLELARENDELRQKLLFLKSEKYLDSGYGECFLKNDEVAELVKNALFYFDGKKYKLVSWVIMPNHLHILIRPQNETSLTNIMHSLKSFHLAKGEQIAQPEREILAGRLFRPLYPKLRTF